MDSISQGGVLKKSLQHKFLGGEINNLKLKVPVIINYLIYN